MRSLLLFVCATYMWCCSSRTLHSWWTTYTAQRQRKGYSGCNNSSATWWTSL